MAPWQEIFYWTFMVLMWIVLGLNVWSIWLNRKRSKLWRDKYMECMVYENYLRHIAGETLSDEAYAELERLMGDD